MSGWRHASTVLLRGLLRRCPNCGDKRPYERWFIMHGRCRQCGILFERVEGYWTGAMAINLVVTELLFLAVMIVAVVKTWPNVPTAKLIISGLIFNGIVHVLFYPIAKTIWIAIDILLHPLEPEEIQETLELQRIRERVVAD